MKNIIGTVFAQSCDGTVLALTTKLVDERFISYQLIG